jgi:hypothetical protein
MKSEFLIHISKQMQMKRYAKRTIESYLYWIKSYIIFNKKKHPKDCYNKEVEAFLSYLSNTKNVAPKTQALALPMESLSNNVYSKLTFNSSLGSQSS